MRSILTVCLVSALVVLAGCCGSGGCGVARAPSMRAPTAYGSAYGSASGSSRVYERSPSVAAREAARPAPTYVRRSRNFTPPAPPALPAAVAARSPSACQPVEDAGCPGGNCAIPSP